ncbi:hypothetical protein BAUCODRAFT_316776 [Baudoinia panamericana UAMH 10762]|uniref:Uncharacterized protein n=1 Tax=Baudoinia panamericana (strain UAMH 10762) TaxID=717646 RepID=M2MX03_BAUPA|nr:uncharacterized protein BAUCODRAFT_316776 [Baudoinia panamericana UAMH 10762]EMC91164.1 hypothetical protein BAUCODRAFT_316776 [Baudoinia panamericana UAMH 10762]
MGRQRFITRMALGRSPYQPFEGNKDDETPTVRGTEVHNTTTTTDGYVQRFDIKGNPINPATESRNAELRHAQNSILALVGVVEGLEGKQRVREDDDCHGRAQWQELLSDENEYGEALDLLTMSAVYLPLFYSIWLLRRYQTGVNDVGRPFASIVASDMRAILKGEWKGVYAVLFPGMLASLCAGTVQLGAAHIIDTVTRSCSKQYWAKRRSSLHLERFERVLAFVETAAYGLIQLFLLPLSFHTTAQCLLLAPPWPLLPPWSLWRRTDPLSPRSIIWRPLIEVPLPLIGRLLSPAALFITWNYLLTEPLAIDGVPFAHLTTFPPPELNTSSSRVTKPILFRDPFGWIRYHVYTVRSSLITGAGWGVKSVGNRSTENHFETNIVMEGNAQTKYGVSHHRSTHLTHLPARFQGARIDEFLYRVLLLPLDALVLRAVAMSYFACPLPKVAGCNGLSTQLYPPISGWLYRLVRRLDVNTLREAGRYANKIGLCLALQAAVDATLFAGVYASVRFCGIRQFHWGLMKRPGRGSFTHPP